MNEQQAFGRLVDSLSPWLDRLVFVGGWAFRLYRLHPAAQVPAYRPVATLDADVAFAEGAQRLLIHNRRPADKKRQDILYVHDTLALFGGELDALGGLWKEQLRPNLHARRQGELAQVVKEIFGRPNDLVRDAAAIPADRRVDPETMRRMCLQALRELFE